MRWPLWLSVPSLVLLTACGLAGKALPPEHPPSQPPAVDGMRAWQAPKGATLRVTLVWKGATGSVYAFEALPQKPEAPAVLAVVLVEGRRTGVLLERNVQATAFTSPPLVFKVGPDQEDVAFPGQTTTGQRAGAFFDVVSVRTGSQPRAVVLDQGGLPPSPGLVDGIVYRKADALVVSGGSGIGWFQPAVLAFTRDGVLRTTRPDLWPQEGDAVLRFWIRKGTDGSWTLKALPQKITLKAGQRLDVIEESRPLTGTDVGTGNGAVLSLVPGPYPNAVTFLARSAGATSLVLDPSAACRCGGGGNGIVTIPVTVQP